MRVNESIKAASVEASMEKSDAEKMVAALENVFNEVSDFIVIGLTGRTGSGCSTAASLLASPKLPLPNIGESHYEGNEARKYRIIKSYIDVKWQPFEWLRVRSVITRYILELSFDEFIKLICQILKETDAEIRAKVGFFEKKYNEFHDKVKAFLFMPDSTVADQNSKKQTAYDLYFKELPIFSNDLKVCLNGISHEAYTSVYQQVGDNIRSSGKADSSQFNPEKIFSFPNVINKAIKSARYVARLQSKKCYIVVDAIRNPYEAVFLKERYADFFLVSVNTENKNRLDHLRVSHKFTDQQIKDLDEKEYPDSLKGDKKFTSQNIQKCIELSDVHINNPRENKYGNSELASQIAWYVSLMMHPGLIVPTSVESCMQLAYSVKKNSGCISRQVGAVVTDENLSVKAVGWNNTPDGQVPCLLRNAEHLINDIDSDAYSYYEKNNEDFHDAMESKYLPVAAKSQSHGRNLAYCFKDVKNGIKNEKNQVHTRSLHAEENAFLQISKYGGQPVMGGVLFTTASPCELCAKKAYQLGVSKIYYIDPYPGIATSHVLSSGLNNPDLILFRGAIGSAFHRLYQPIMPYKDELEMLLSLQKNGNKEEIRLNELQIENNELRKKIAILEARSTENGKN